MSETKMVKHDEAQEIKKEVKSSVVKAVAKKSKVNMFLPHGSVLTIGEIVELNDEDQKHLSDKFSKDDIKHLME